MWTNEKDQQYAAIPEAQAMPLDEDLEKGFRGEAHVKEQYGVYPINRSDSLDMEQILRLGFIRKVYGVLTCQLLLTVVFSAMAMYIEPMRNFIAGNSAVLYISLFASIGLLIALMCFKTQFPTSVILLGLWTLCEAATVGVITASYASVGAGSIVIEAAAITLTVFVALTIFTFQTKIDFTFLGGFLFAGLWVLIAWGLISAILGIHTGTVYAALGALIFTGYILFDTSLIMKRLGYDEWILASISLYLDILNLFLYILQLLSRDR